MCIMASRSEKLYSEQQDLPLSDTIKFIAFPVRTYHIPAFPCIAMCTRHICAGDMQASSVGSGGSGW